MLKVKLCKMIKKSIALSMMVSVISGVVAFANSSNGASNNINIEKIAGYSVGMQNEDGGVAEIVKYNSDNNKTYVINGEQNTIDIVDMSELKDENGQTLKKYKTIDIAKIVNEDGFEYGDVTSIDINTSKKIVAVSVQEKDYKKQGKIVVLDYEGNKIDIFKSGIQPDCLKISKDGKYIITADEGEPREGITGEGWDPEGSITIVDYETKEVKSVKFDDSSKIDNDVHIRNKEGGAVVDLEPEYIAVSDDNIAYVTLQENNSVATIDISSRKVLSVKSLGLKDFSKKGNEIDAARDGKIDIKNLPIKGLYMPDTIDYVNIDGKGYLLTANEGDATEWGKGDFEFCNVSSFSKFFEDRQLNINDNTFLEMNKKEADEAFEQMKKETYIDSKGVEKPSYGKLEVLTDMGDDAIYILGGRSFSIWEADTMNLVYDSGSDFEDITAKRIPEYFNCSNDDLELDKRSSKKGPEPEALEIGKIGNDIYAFIGLERTGGFMMYNITNPVESTFIDYFTTRDFSSDISGDVAPEGMDFISEGISITKKPMLIVGNEVSGTLSINQFTVNDDKEDNEDNKDEEIDDDKSDDIIIEDNMDGTIDEDNEGNTTDNIEDEQKDNNNSSELPKTGMIVGNQLSGIIGILIIAIGVLFKKSGIKLLK